MPLHRDAILLTPDPLTTSLRTKLAMLRDWCSRDEDFIAVTASVRKSLLDIVHGQDSHVAVPLQGSGTFSVEAAIATVVPRTGHVLVLDNGAYCKRAAKLSTLMGQRTTALPFDDAQVVSPQALDAALQADASISHVLVALHEAIAQFAEEGGQSARLMRYQANCDTLLRGMAALGFVPFLPPISKHPSSSPSTRRWIRLTNLKSFTTPLNAMALFFTLAS